MKKFLNQPETFVDEMIDGIIAAHPDQLRLAGGDRRCVVSAKSHPGKVGLATMAGTVHLYPTLSEISKRAAGNYFASRLFSDKTRSILRLFFNLKGRAC